MKFRRMILGCVFAFALIASFAFKAESKKKDLENVYFNPISDPFECAVGELDTPNDCEIFNSGAQCTVEDWVPGDGDAQVPAYADLDGGTPCFYSLYHAM